MTANNFDIKGLTNQQVDSARLEFGENSLRYKKQHSFAHNVKETLKEPMVVLLLVTAVIYFASGKTGDALFLTVAIFLVVAISLYQDSRSRNALEKLKDLTQPHCKVIREGEIREIPSSEIVLGDSLMVEEGMAIAADATIVRANDFSVNESILTGESMPVAKDQSQEAPFIYLGSSVASGLAIATVTAIGNDTKLGKIGNSLEAIVEEKTPLELQIGNFVKKMVLVGAVVFVVVWAINYIHSKSLIDSLTKALTLAMSILPEEIPVAFTTFMALGAWRLMKKGIVVKQMKTVETLGSATVICTDKTGTLTQNKMTLAKLYALASTKPVAPDGVLSAAEKELLATAMWASEPIPFDAMEIALHQSYQDIFEADERPEYRMVKEYPLGGNPPMMTHVFEKAHGQRIIAAKGAPEALMAVSGLTPDEERQTNEAIASLAKEGYRILGVGICNFEGNQWPVTQQALVFDFLGLVAFYDPPKENIGKVLSDFYAAGIAVKIITGDNAATTATIAQQVGFVGYDKSISGDELLKLSPSELQERVKDTNLFTRMFPEAKLKIINALKANHEIVAMTGDGVNDGPALKAAHIGIAMGIKGTEIAKQAASLILLEDDLSKMVDAVAMGRKIYANLKKAIQYIISIHIPIILTVFLPLALGWMYPNIFSPVHIIFLEMIMGPTCSIIYENEPMEKNTMLQKPRPFTATFFNWKELSVSIVQGLVITAGALLVYQFAVAQGYSEARTRTMIFTVLIMANIVLTLVNRSFYYSILTTLRYKNNSVAFIILLTLGLLALLLYVKPFTVFFNFETLTAMQFLLCCLVGVASVIWFEVVKALRRRDVR
jgi:P-type Ca2+ transporter type 2C